MNDITRIVESINPGDGQEAETLLPLVYDELRKLAQARMTDEPAGHTLDPTALVHEAWLRMVNEKDRTWHNQSYFFTVASTAMRRVLVDHARRKATVKHGGNQQRINFELLDVAEALTDEKTLLVDDALERLEKFHPKWAQIVVMKYFGGMVNREVAESLGVSERTVERWWVCAKSWLYNSMRKQM